MLITTEIDVRLDRPLEQASVLDQRILAAAEQHLATRLGVISVQKVGSTRFVVVLDDTNPRERTPYPTTSLISLLTQDTAFRLVYAEDSVWKEVTGCLRFEVTG